MVCGVSFRRYPRIHFRSPWQRVVRDGNSNKGYEPIIDEIAAKLSAYCKVPQSYARFYILPLMKFFFKNHHKAVAITQLLRLDIQQVAFFTRDTETAERVYQDSITLTKGTGYEKHEHIVENVEATVKVEKEEGMGKEEEVRVEENKNRKQRSLSDFLSL